MWHKIAEAKDITTPTPTGERGILNYSMGVFTQQIIDHRCSAVPVLDSNAHYLPLV